MIAWLSGQVVDATTANLIVLNVAGVGYAVETTTATHAILSTQNQTVQLLIHTQVREDAINLYGFLEVEERALFRALIKVNGIGPKSAMGILSAMSPSVFIQAIQLQDKSMLTKLPGVGSKTAERMLIEMRDILKDVNLPQVLTSVQSSIGQEAISALEVLGYRPHEASKVVKKLDTGQEDAQTLIKLALKHLAKC
jgi:Holliday junction DNA helicase RuvA